MNLKNFYENAHTKINVEGNKYLKVSDRGAALYALAGNPSGLKILDLGCQFGDVTKYFVKDNDVTIVDFNVHAVKYMAETYGVKAIEAGFDGDPLPFSDETFDMVILSEVIEHLFYYQEIINESSRVLKTGGTFVGSTPNAFNLRARIGFLLNRPGKAFNDEHIRFFNLQILDRLLKKNFSKVNISGFKGFFRNINRNFFAHVFLWSCKK